MEHTLRDVMLARGTTALVIADEAERVVHAVDRMNTSHVGSVLVLSDGDLVGIVTERDILRRVVGEGRDPAHTKVAEIMSAPLLCALPTMTVSAALQLMTRLRTRHLPVVDEANVVGLVSIGDLTHWLTKELRQSLTELAQYICGPAVRIDQGRTYAH